MKVYSCKYCNDGKSYSRNDFFKHTRTQDHKRLKEYLINHKPKTLNFKISNEELMNKVKNVNLIEIYNDEDNVLFKN